jgi:hypothetical protein
MRTPGLTGGQVLVRVTWQPGSPTGAMAVTMAVGDTTVLAGCLAVSSSGVCSFQIAVADPHSANGPMPLAVSQTALVALTPSQMYVIVAASYGNDSHVDARLYTGNGSSSGQVLLASTSSVPIEADLGTAQFGFVNPDVGFSCVQRYEIASLCQPQEAAVNGTCIGEWSGFLFVCLFARLSLTTPCASFSPCLRLHRGPKALR